MKVTLALVLLAVVIGLGWFRFFTMEYRGERILLSYPRFDQDAFENAEKKLSKRQAARVEQLLLEAKLEPAYQNLPAAVAAAHELVVSGYGSRGLARIAPSGEKLFMTCVEIPETGQDRCFLFAQTSSGLRLIDDVVVDSLVADLDAKSTPPTYRDRDGNLLPVIRRTTVVR